MNIRHSSESIEHYTPPEYAESFRKIMDGISLDVSSSVIANTIVQARRFLTVEDDALTVSWYGTSVYCNPPGGKTKNKSNQSIWFEKMHKEWILGNFDEGIFMAFNNSILRTNPTSYMKFPFCIPKDRIRFWNTKSDLLAQEKKNKTFNLSRHTKKCIMCDEIIFVDSGEILMPSPSPSHDNVIIYFYPKHHSSKRLNFKAEMDKHGQTRI